PMMTEPAPHAPPTPTPIAELSAVMPAYNEEEVLPFSIAEAVAALDEIAARWELLVVDDGSRDRTPEIVAEWVARNDRIRLLKQPMNLGYSRALIRGFREARYEWVCYTDADAQFDLREVRKLYDQAGGVEMVVGYRTKRQDPSIRLLTSAVYNRLQGLVLGVRVRDCNCALKLFRRDFLQSLPLDSDGFLIDAELYARTRRAGGRWREVGVTHRPRELGRTTVRVATIVKTLRELWALRRSIARGETAAR
ncbi:MAG TPA: glycosyltransferase family 2 protein, partial [Candidatus Polarisedimenticolaceae bacterium]|nr:glycosyltransferase family 2 protein [Candidatus Polarisedimenticolaceae bacterium]